MSARCARLPSRPPVARTHTPAYNRTLYTETRDKRGTDYVSHSVDFQGSRNDRLGCHVPQRIALLAPYTFAYRLVDSA